MLSEEFTEQEKQKLELASNIAFSYFPHLAGIFRKLDIRFSAKVETAGVTSSGKLLLNRDFFNGLPPGLETAFLLAHELLHLAQMIFERGKAFYDQESLNIAHDILINEQLCKTMGFPEPPLGGLSWQWFLSRYKSRRLPSGLPAVPNMKGKASNYSLEELVRVIISLKEHDLDLNKYSWKTTLSRQENDSEPDSFENHPFADLFDKEKISSGKDDPENGGKITLDLIGNEQEESLFPEEDKALRGEQTKELAEVCLDAAAQNILLPFSPDGKGGNDSGGWFSDVEIVRSCYSPPWEMAMQRWFDGAAVPRRSWARASRRGAWRNDVVLPGRNQDCFILHLILDTSGSMTELIPHVLSKISAFARNVGMAQVHILQCDADLRKDEYVEIDQLETYQVNGFGWSDMSPAMLKLAEDPEITHVLVITDGDISYPEETDIPYEVLWCIPDNEDRPSFPYGQVIYVPITD